MSDKIKDRPRSKTKSNIDDKDNSEKNINYTNKENEELLEILKSIPSIDENRIKEIKEKIENGELNILDELNTGNRLISAEKIAEAILKSKN